MEQMNYNSICKMVSSLTLPQHHRKEEEKEGKKGGKEGGIGRGKERRRREKKMGFPTS